MGRGGAAEWFFIAVQYGTYNNAAPLYYQRANKGLFRCCCTHVQFSLHWKSREEGGTRERERKGLCALVRICAHDVMSTLPLSLFPISSSFSLFSGPSGIVCPSSTRIWATTKPLVFLPPPPPPHLSHTKKPKEEEGLFQTPSSPGDDDGCDCGGGRGGGGGGLPPSFHSWSCLTP